MAAALPYIYQFVVSYAVNALLAEDVEGPKLNDTRVTSSTYGSPIYKCYGTIKTGGQLIWSDDLKEHSQSQGKGGGDVTTYSYTGSFAVSVCEGPVTGVLRIWADNILIWSDIGTGNDSVNEALSRVFGLNGNTSSSVRIYLGGETQEPDSFIEAIEGIGNTPAYRGLCYIVFQNLPLENHGNRIPNITVEIADDVTSTIKAHTELMTFDPAYLETQTSHIEDNVITVYEHPSQFSESMYINEITLIDGIKRRIGTFNSPVGYVRRIQHRGLHGRDADYIETILDSTRKTVRLYDRLATTYTQYTVPAGNTITNGAIAKDDYEVWISSAEGNLFYFRVSQADHIATRTGTGFSNYLFVSSRYVYLSRTPSLTKFILKRYPKDLSSGETLIDTTSWPFTDGLSNIDDRVIIYVDDNENVFLWHRNRFYSYEDGSITDLGKRSGLARADNDEYCHAFRVYDSNVIVYSGNQVNGNRHSIGYAYDYVTDNSATTLESVVSSVSTDAGLVAADFDYSDLTDTVRGYAITQQTSGRNAIEPMRKAYYFDIIESGFQLKGIKRGGSSIATITQDDLAARSSNSKQPTKLIRTRTNDSELPQKMEVMFLNKNHNYETGHQIAQRIAIDTVNGVSVELPLVLTEDEAGAISHTLLHSSWKERTKVEFTLPINYFYLDSSDVISVTSDNVTYSVRISDIDYELPSLIKMKGVTQSQGLYNYTIDGGNVIDVPQYIAVMGPTKEVFLDIPLLRDADDSNGFYFAACGYYPNWAGCILYRSEDGGDSWTNELGIVDKPSTIGYTTNTLGDASQYIVDDSNSVNISLIQGSFESITETEILEGGNALLIGDEIVNFADATLEADGTWTLSTFLRGQKGTNIHRSGHASGELCVFLDPDVLLRIDQDVAQIGTSYSYKAVTIRTFESNTTAVSFTNTADALECYNPRARRAVRQSNNDLVITWDRRNRIQQEWIDYGDVPMSETSESYEIVINGPSRLLTSSSETVTYTAAQQITDFGSYQSSVSVTIYQLSSIVGRGYGQGISLTVE